MLSWVGKALDAEMMITKGLIVAGREVPAGGSVTLRDLAAAGLIHVF
jgi:hypothetical protein